MCVLLSCVLGAACQLGGSSFSGWLIACLVTGGVIVLAVLAMVAKNSLRSQRIQYAPIGPRVLTLAQAASPSRLTRRKSHSSDDDDDDDVL